MQIIILKQGKSKQYYVLKKIYRSSTPCCVSFLQQAKANLYFRFYVAIKLKTTCCVACREYYKVFILYFIYIINFRDRRDSNTLTLPPKRSNHPVGILPLLINGLKLSYVSVNLLILILYSMGLRGTEKNFTKQRLLFLRSRSRIIL